MAVRVPFSASKKHQSNTDGKGFRYPDAAGKTLGELLVSAALGESGMSAVLLMNGGGEKPDYVLHSCFSLAQLGILLCNFGHFCYATNSMGAT